MKILSFDPSGNYNEGKGTTGWAWSIDGDVLKCGDIKSSDFSTREWYWFEHAKLIGETKPDVCVIESYRLQGHKAKQQTGSELETPMLIGYMQMVCWERHIPVVFQDPTTKSRHADDILVKTGYFTKVGNGHIYFRGEKTNLHQRDSIRHNLYFWKYGGKKFENR